MRKTYTYALTGGIDEASQPLAIAPGRALAALNHEVLESGYGRIDGFERFDGRTSPTDYPFHLISFIGGVGAIVAGNTITGATSGATGVVLVDADLTSGAWDGTGAGDIGFRTLTGNFQNGENIQVGGVTKAVAAGTQRVGGAFSGDVYEDSVAAAARTYGRSLIAAVPGSGQIRGIVELDDTVYAFRDNVGATAVAIYKSTASGWSLVSPVRYPFNSGGVTEIVAGNTVTGATSAATGVVGRVVVTSGTWAGGNAAGYLYLHSITGTFGAAENLDVGASLNLATMNGAASAVTLPAGGRYFFAVHNFYGSSGTRRIYGCNGVGTAFEFNGTWLAPNPTGATTDTPSRIAVFRNKLVLALPNGGVQISEPDEPFGWDGASGAVVIGIGSDVADFIAHTDALMILGLHGIFSLTGNDSTDFVLGTVTLEAGAKPYTAQRISGGLYLDNRGLRSIQASQNFGNFQMGTASELVQKTLRTKALAGTSPVASVIVRTKNHYRLFFDDGSGLSFYVGRKSPEAMYFDLGVAVKAISSAEMTSGRERVLFGDADGYVYQLDKGSSFDGDDIPAFLQLAYANMGSPNLLKRVHKVELEASSSAACTLNFATEYDDASNEQTSTATGSADVQGTGGFWGIVNWAEFYWSGPNENVLSVEMEGQGRNASLIVHSLADDFPPYVLRGATIHYSERGAMR